MSTRPSRSASIPIPRGTSSLSPSRNIESVLSIPFATPGRPRLSSSQAFPQRPNITDDHRGLGISYGTRGSSSTATSAHPSRPTARSMTYSAGIPWRGSPRTNTTFEPRVIRAGAETSQSADTPCLPSSSSPSSRVRRPSGASGRATSAQRQVSSQTISTPPSPPVSFARPAYLEHSALRHMLHTEPPPLLPPSRKLEASFTDTHGYSVAMSPSTDSDDESDVSPPRKLSLTTPTTTSEEDQILRLPTRWSDQFRHALLSVSGDGRELTYHGASCSGDRDAAAARTIYPIPSACGIYYYEVDILCKGQKGHISIGFAAREVKLSRLPGWESNSWGYHGDDGCSFAAEKNGTPYGPTFGTGDVVGCGIDFTTHRAFFTKNGTLIGPVFENIGKDIDIFPSVGLRHANEAIRVNFGHEPFKYDIDYHVQQQRNQTWANILTTPLDSSLLEHHSKGQDHDSKGDVDISYDVSTRAPLSEAQTKGVINKLVLSYLEHHGYAKTVRTFRKQHGVFSGQAPQVPDLSPMDDGHDIDMDGIVPYNNEGDIERRTRIVNSVITGDIDTALAETKTHYPAVLEAEEGLMLFKLRCRKFVELILEAADLKKSMKNQALEDSMIDETNGMAEEGMHMDVDDDGSSPPSSTNGFVRTAIPVRGSRRRASVSPGRVGGWARGAAAQYEMALNQAISYGQVLSNDYRTDTRPEVRYIFKRTFAIVAWEDPMAAGGIATEVVGHEAGVSLANELNQAILKSQGRPTDPALETLYRHTAACVVQLGLLGVGAAAYADMPKEFLDG